MPDDISASAFAPSGDSLPLATPDPGLPGSSPLDGGNAAGKPRDHAEDAGGIADGVRRELDPRWVGLQRRRRAVGTAVLAAVFLPVPLGSALALGVMPTLSMVLLWFAFVLLLAWQAWSWPAIAHRHASYRLNSQGLEIRRGVVFRSVVNVPRSRVQHTDVSQGPLERSFGLGRLIIFTAGSSYARVELHGLDHDTALRMRDFLLPDEGGDAV